MKKVSYLTIQVKDALFSERIYEHKKIKNEET